MPYLQSAPSTHSTGRGTNSQCTNQPLSTLLVFIVTIRDENKDINQPLSTLPCFMAADVYKDYSIEEYKLQIYEDIAGNIQKDK